MSAHEFLEVTDRPLGRAAVPLLFLTAVLATFTCLLFYCRGGDAQGEAGTGSLPVEVDRLQAEMDISGKIVFQSDVDGDDEIYLLQGRRIEKLTDNTWDDRYPRWSPDGGQIAYIANPQGQFDLFVLDMRRGKSQALTRSTEDELDAAWFPDGKGIAFSTESKKILGRKRRIWRLDLATGGAARLLPAFSGSHQLPDLSPVPSQVAFTGKKGFGWDVFIADLSDKSIRQITTQGKACRARFSPDGRRVAYVSSEADGKGDIWVAGVDGRQPRRLTLRPEAFDYFPSWSPDGGKIVFCSNFKDKYADKGEWGLYLLDPDSGRVERLFDSPGRDVFPDWH